MKIIISNIVTLNGGDFAILESMMRVLKQTYGEDVKFIVYDLHAEAAQKYYPGIEFRTLLYVKYKQKRFTRKPRLYRLTNKFSALNRFMIAGRLYSKGKHTLASLLLTNQEKTDFNNYTSADIIISTGGTYLVENYSLDARFYDYNFTLALNKPLVFFTQSLGPFTNPFNQAEIKKIFDKASLVLLRDKASLNNLKEVGVNVSKAQVCADVVFSDALPGILKSAKNKKIETPLKVGISVRDWKFFKGRTEQEGTEFYYNSIAAICEHITITLNGEVLFVSTCQGIKEYHLDDSKTAGKIYNRLSDEAKNRTSVNTDFHTPADLKKIVEKLDIVISTRMHGAIQALSVGVPVLPIAYEFKTKELFSKLIDVNHILDIDTLVPQKAVEVFDTFLQSLETSREVLFDKVLQEHLSAVSASDHMKKQVSY